MAWAPFWLDGWTATGENKSGTGAVSETSAATATGTKAASGTTTLAQPSIVTATGVRTIGGSGTISQPSSATATGVHGGRGTGTAPQSSTAAGSGTKATTGPGFVNDVSDAETTDGETQRFGVGTIIQSSTTAAEGVAVEQEPVGGVIIQPAATSADGTTGRFGTGGILHSAVTGEPVVTDGAGPGNALAVYYPQPTYLPVPKRCRCNGRPSRECEVHCHLIEERQHAEDELLVLALV